MKLRTVGLAAVTIALALATTGCAADAEKSPTTPSSSSTPEAPPKPPAASTPAGPAALSCDTLVTELTLAEFEYNGFVHEEDFEKQLRSNNSIEARFFDYGGLACRWFLPNSDAWASFGYSEITDADADAVQQELVALGYVRTVEGTDVVYSITPSNNNLGHNDTFLFEAGAWFHSIERNGIDEVRAALAVRAAG